MVVSRQLLALSVAALLAGCAASAEPPSHLGRGARSGDAVVTTISVESHYGHGTATGPVRKGNRDLEVRLPGGTWIECGPDCHETLRRETVDFWENHGRNGRDGPRYFNWSR